MISKILNSLNANRNKVINSVNTKNSIKFFESNFYSLKAKNFFTLNQTQNKNLFKNQNFNFASKNDNNEFDDVKFYNENIELNESSEPNKKETDQLDSEKNKEENTTRNNKNRRLSISRKKFKNKDQLKLEANNYNEELDNYNNPNQEATIKNNKNNEETIKNDEKTKAAISKIKNKLGTFIINYDRLKYPIIISKILNIEKEILTFDLIKSFEESFLKNEQNLIILAKEWNEKFPKLKTYRNFREGRGIEKRYKNVCQKVIDYSEVYDEVTSDSVFFENFVFFEPLLEYIKANLENHKKNITASKKVMQINKPEDLFPKARKLKRKFIYHYGPTNSGKTSNAIKRLAEAKSGIYCAPLRLLAWEVFEKLKKMGVKCNLSTGQDSDYTPNNTHISMTIEKSDMHRHYDVAIIDEIQMIEDEERGSAWTNAVLGLQANEIHLCGDERGLSLLKKLCNETGDELYYKSYNRFSNLIVEDHPFDYADLRPGDCIISFNKVKIMDIKRNILNLTRQMNKDSVGIIYGDLPSDTKKEQAKTFNELTYSHDHQKSIKYDFLVASDAIGMGLNLSINRIIFSTTEKYKTGPLAVPLLKQIAGRAGRSTSDGFVTAFYPKDLEYIRTSLGDTVGKGLVPTDFEAPEELLDENFEFSETQMVIKKACLFPAISDVLRIANKLQEEYSNLNKTQVSIYDVFLQFDIHSNSNDLYFFKDLKKSLKIAYMLKDIESSIENQYKFMLAPCKTKEFCLDMLRNFFIDFKNGKGNVLIPEILYIDKYNYIDRKVSLDEIMLLQEKHNCLEIYLNLSNKFRDNFSQAPKAKFLKTELTKVINMLLKHGSRHEYENVN